MIHVIFVYRHTGLLCRTIEFSNILKKDPNLISSFLTVVKCFINGDHDDLIQFETGYYAINICNIRELGVDLAIISDKGKEKKIKKLCPKIRDILLDNCDLFVDDGEIDKFMVLDEPIINIIKQKYNGSKISNFLQLTF
jgi:hypothetical protein